MKRWRGKGEGKKEQGWNEENLKETKWKCEKGK